MKPHIRAADESDLERINEIYNAVMVDSHVSFDVEPWDLDKRSSWWERYASGRYDAYVAEAGGTVVGVAYSGPYRDKVAYDSSVETTIVLDAAVTGRGIGRRCSRPWSMRSRRPAPIAPTPSLPYQTRRRSLCTSGSGIAPSACSTRSATRWGSTGRR